MPGCIEQDALAKSMKDQGCKTDDVKESERQFVSQPSVHAASIPKSVEKLQGRDNLQINDSNPNLMIPVAYDVGDKGFNQEVGEPKGVTSMRVDEGGANHVESTPRTTKHPVVYLRHSDTMKSSSTVLYDECVKNHPEVLQYPFFMIKLKDPANDHDDSIDRSESKNLKSLVDDSGLNANSDHENPVNEVMKQIDGPIGGVSASFGYAGGFLDYGKLHHEDVTCSSVSALWKDSNSKSWVAYEQDADEKVRAYLNGHRYGSCVPSALHKEFNVSKDALHAVSKPIAIKVTDCECRPINHDNKLYDWTILDHELASLEAGLLKEYGDEVGADV